MGSEQPKQDKPSNPTETSGKSNTPKAKPTSVDKSSVSKSTFAGNASSLTKSSTPSSSSKFKGTPVANSSSSKPKTSAPAASSSSKPKTSKPLGSSKNKSTPSSFSKPKINPSAQSSSNRKAQSTRDKLYQKCADEPDREFDQDELLAFGIVTDKPELLERCNELIRMELLHMFHTGSKAVFKARVGEVAGQLAALSRVEKDVYKAIEATGSRGAWKRSLRYKTDLHPERLGKALKALEKDKLVKQVNSVQHRSRKVYLVSGVRLTEDITGGCWYTDAEIDQDFVEEMTEYVVNFVKQKSWLLGEKVSLQALDAVIANSNKDSAAAAQTEEDKQGKADEKLKPKSSARSQPSATASDTEKAMEKIKSAPVKSEQDADAPSHIQELLHVEPIVDRRSQRALILPSPDYKNYPTATDVFQFIDGLKLIKGKSYTREDMSLLLEKLVFDGRLEKVGKRGGNAKILQEEQDRRKRIEKRQLERLGLKRKSFSHEPTATSVETSSLSKDKDKTKKKKNKTKEGADAADKEQTSTPAALAKSKKPDPASTPSSAPTSKPNLKRTATGAGIDADNDAETPMVPAKKPRKSDPGPSAVSSTKEKDKDKQPPKRISGANNPVEISDDEDSDDDLEPETTYRASRMGLALDPPFGREKKKPSGEQQQDGNAGASVGPAAEEVMIDDEMEIEVGGFMYGESYPEVPCAHCPVMSVCKPQGPINPRRCGYMAEWVDL
ncbi:MAG: 34-kDa subunit of RNA polymerase III (C) [Alyxoria varia]|nr:MAG: 34-kDa subunit of RNA polymerase III (C) [Alyxoria varia]